MEPFHVFIKKEHLPATIVEVLCYPGTVQNSSDALIKYEYFIPIREQLKDSLISGAVIAHKKVYEYVKPPIEGEVGTIDVNVGECIDQPNQSVVTLLVPCNHSRTVINDYCADCGEYWSSQDFVAFDHNESNIKISQQEAMRIAKGNKERLINSKRLTMVLDLDQTIIQATVDQQIGLWMQDENNVNHPATKDIGAFQLPDKEYVYYIKPRNGLKEFLETVHQLFELHVYTMGTRLYAEAVCKVIDPTGEYFSDRILSRDENGSYFKKDLKRLFPADHSLVVVLDDRPDVWSWSPSLIKVVPFEFFGVGDINSDTMKEKDLSAISSSESSKENASQEKPKLIDNDRELLRLLVVIKELHRRFFSLYDRFQPQDSSGDNDLDSCPDVMTVLSGLKHEVLGGTRLLFSDIFNPREDPRNSDPWRWAESFGAKCYLRPSPDVTHVLARDPRSESVRASLGFAGVHFLNPQWLFDSLVYWNRQPEKHYQLKGLVTPAKRKMEDLANSAFTDTPPGNGDTVLESLEASQSDLREDPLDENMVDVGEPADPENDLDLNIAPIKWELHDEDIDAELEEMGILSDEMVEEYDDDDIDDLASDEGNKLGGEDIALRESVQAKRPRSTSPSEDPPKILVTEELRSGETKQQEINDEGLSDDSQQAETIGSDDWENAFEETSREHEDEISDQDENTLTKSPNNKIQESNSLPGRANGTNSTMSSKNNHIDSHIVEISSLTESAGTHLTTDLVQNLSNSHDSESSSGSGSSSSGSSSDSESESGSN